MLIFGDTLINMKTENRWKKIRAQPQGAKKNSCTSQRRKKILNKTKLPNPPPPPPSKIKWSILTFLKTNNVKTSANYILKCQRTQIRENLHMTVKNKLNLRLKIKVTRFAEKIKFSKFSIQYLQNPNLGKEEAPVYPL